LGRTALALWVAALTGWAAAPAAAHHPGNPNCASAALYVAAHADDTLLFQSPDLFQDIHTGRCVRTVFLTAGDAGRAQAYWSGREEGAKAAYAYMAGVANQWHSSQWQVGGRSIRLDTLAGQPWISLAFMRLPDGGVHGKGTERYGFDSLMKLWQSQHGGEPADSAIAAVDGSATYGYQGLVDTLAAMIEEFEPRLIATQNYTGVFIGPDHSDHVGTALFTREAHVDYEAPHRLLAYEDYEVTKRPENVFGELLGAKSFAFYAYGAHDSDACLSESDCHGTPYAKWLPRQYVAAAETVGVVAHAGYSQLATTSATVSLDGTRSAAEGGAALEYEWTQVSGAPVTLSNRRTASPSFLAPPHPTVLTFELVVSDGVTVSEPDLVRVRIPTSDPTPSAVVGPDQEVLSGATVELDGSASWDPHGLPLEYAWLQIAGPAVELTGSDTAKPRFVAPPAPATLEFELMVSNGSETSAPARVIVGVKKAPAPDPPDPLLLAPPPLLPQGETPDGSSFVRLSRSRLSLPAGRRSRRLVRVLGERLRVACKGDLPRGARCLPTDGGHVVVEGSRRLRRAGNYPLVVSVGTESGAVRLPLLVQVRAQRP
jgi:LmbE family N-acetylglucosaminyl deacetylase